MSNYIFIPQLIFEILVKHGSLYLPTVGCLNSVRIAASLTGDGTDFIPPRYIVEYNNSVDDNSLVDIIAQSEGVAVADAKRLYDSWLSLISEHLDGGVRYAIEGVGVLYLYAEGSAMFAIDDALSLYLNPFLSDKDIEAYNMELTASHFDAAQALDLQVAKASTQKKANLRNNCSKAMGKQDFLRLFFILLIVFSAIGTAFIAVNYHSCLLGLRGYFSPQHTTEISADQTVYKDSVPLVKAGSVPSVKAGSVASAKAVSVPSVLYHVVAGSFKNGDLAKKYAALFNPSQVIYNDSSGFYLVVLYSAQSQVEANRKIEELPALKYPYKYWVWLQHKIN